MDMRLGKTLVTIRRLKLVPPQGGDALRVLVVAPISALALGTWEDELKTEGLEYTRLMGTRDQRLKQLKTSTAWVLTNKESHRAIPELGAAKVCTECDGKHGNYQGEYWVLCGKCRGRGFLPEKPLIRWDAVILDESVFIKNPKPLATKFFLSAFKDVPRRWILTGLPNPEGPIDYVNQILFLDKEFMGCTDYYQFRQRYYMPHCSGHGWIPRPGTEAMVNEAIGKRCFIMRRSDCGMDREKIYSNRYIEMPKKIRRTYKTAEKEFILEYDGIEKKTIWSMVRYIWLRRLCGGFIDDQKIWDGKIKGLVNLLMGELAKEQVVVWFSYLAEIHEAESALKKAGVSRCALTGRLNELTRKHIIKDFQNSNIRVLLIQYQVAESGVDLSAADTAIYFSEPLGLHARKQTEDRILNLNKSGPLLYVHLLVEKSVDTDIRKAMQGKDKLSSRQLNEALRISMGVRHGSY
jgi:SNF2 family DNA or RNA helicase